MRTSEDIVERVRNATSIVDVVSEHVRLRKRGRNHIGLCPFHSEKTPSFNVLEDKGIFKCFGCGEAGDVFTFVMKIEGLTFPETLEKLAKQAGIDYTRQERHPDEQEDKTELLVSCDPIRVGRAAQSIPHNSGKKRLSGNEERSAALCIRDVGAGPSSSS